MDESIQMGLQAKARREEATKQGAPLAAFDAAIRELMSDQFYEKSGIAYNDHLLPAELTSRLAMRLGALAERCEDFHPGSGRIVRDLIHPSLFALVLFAMYWGYVGLMGVNRKLHVRARWDAVVVFSILYTSVVLPLRITFGNAENLADPLSIIDFLIDALFMVDIYLNFNTGFDDDGTVVMDAQIVRFHYLRSFFFIDLIATIPFDLLVFCFPDSEEQGDTRLYLRLPRLLRLLRLPRMFRYLNRWEDILPINAVALRMFKLLFSVIMFAHMNACMYPPNVVVRRNREHVRMDSHAVAHTRIHH